MIEGENLNTFQYKEGTMNKELKSRLLTGMLAVGISFVVGGFYLLSQNKTALGLTSIGIGFFIIGVRYGD